MTALSDILILFTAPLSDEAMQKAKAVLMDCGRSVLVHQKDGQSRSVLVKFDPAETSPAGLLEAVRRSGLSATMAGG